MNKNKRIEIFLFFCVVARLSRWQFQPLVAFIFSLFLHPTHHAATVRPSTHVGGHSGFFGDSAGKGSDGDSRGNGESAADDDG